ncbi:MAG: hypothetical protein H7Y38_02860 [Armatimonadetes bacterium]|nr:hypothetical protein [Armatimonadota bacterium]
MQAATNAEKVLAIFESAYPEDKRPRAAIKAARDWVHGEIGVSEARHLAFAAHAAARCAMESAACAAARAAGHAAATVHVASHSRHVVAYAEKARGLMQGTLPGEMTPFSDPTE